MTPWWLLVFLFVGQSTTYVWTDQDGQDHYTDDLSSVPKGVKVRTTEGEPLGVIKVKGDKGDAAAKNRVVRSEADAEVDSETGPELEENPRATATTNEVDTCANARRNVSAAEQRLAAERSKKSSAEELGKKCMRLLATSGQGAYAQCMVASGPAEEARQKKMIEAAEADLEVAHDALRRAQSAGCRR